MIQDQNLNKSQQPIANTQISQADIDFKSLAVQNYFNIAKQTTNQYIKSLIFLSKTFNFNEQAFQKETISSQNQSLWQDFKNKANQSTQSILKFNQNKEFFASYSGFTRKSNSIVFLIIQNSSSDSSLNIPNNYIKILFFNCEKRLIHVLSHLQINSIEKLAKFMAKHFTVLEKLVLFFPLRNNLGQQEQNKILNIFKSLQKVVIIRQQHPMFAEEPDRTDFWNQRRLKKQNISFLCSQNSIQVLYNQDLCFEEVSQYAVQCFELEKIYGSIIQNCLKSEYRIHQILSRNVVVNNIIAFYFNIIISIKQMNLFEIPTNGAPEEMSIIIAKLFLFSINKYSTLIDITQQDGEFSKLCFPHLFQTSKKCFVCKQSKPKFGCLKCTAKFKKQIHLCINRSCFKLFHTQTKIYIPNSLVYEEADILRLKNNYQIETNTKMEYHKQMEIHTKTERYHKQDKQTVNGSIDSSQIINKKKEKEGHLKLKHIRKRVKQIAQKYNLQAIDFKGCKLYNMVLKKEAEKYKKLLSQTKMNMDLKSILSLQQQDQDQNSTHQQNS